MPSTSAPNPTTAGRVLAVIRLAWSTALLAAPGRLIAALGGQVDSRSVTVARILGARHAIQGIVELATWPKLRRLGSAVDAAHSLTAALLAMRDAPRRRVAITDTVIAAGFASAGLAK